jgi:hypothetical protein
MSEEKRTFPAISIYKFSMEFGKIVFRSLMDLRQVREHEGEFAVEVINILKANSFSNTYEERKVYSKKSPNDFYIRRDMLTMTDNDLIKKTLRISKEFKKPLSRTSTISKQVTRKKKIQVSNPTFDVTTIHIPKYRIFTEIDDKGKVIENVEPLRFLGGAAAAKYFGIEKSVLYMHKKEVIEIKGKIYKITKYLSE